MQLRTIFVVSAIASLALVGCGDKKKSVERPPIEVSTLTATPTTTFRWVDTFGQTEGAEEVEVRAQVSGVLRKLNFKEGESVKAGQTLFEIEKEPYEAQVRQARAQTEQAKTELVKARRDAKRASELIKVNAVSRQEYDDAQSALAMAKSALALAQAQQTNAEIDLSHAMVPAPVDGIAGKSEVNIGSLITSGTTLLTSITQPDTLRVSFAVSDKNLVGARLTKDNLVRVFIPDTKDFLPAKLDYIGQQIDADRGTLRLRAVLPPTKKLLPGQYVEVRLMLGEYKDAYLVPQGVVRQRSDGTYSVYVIEEGVAREKEVLLGNWEGSDWIVTNGLKPGDKVITNQILRLRDGLRVTEKSSNKTDSSEPVKP